MRFIGLEVITVWQEVGPFEDEADGPTTAEKEEDDTGQRVACEMTPPYVRVFFFGMSRW